MTVKVLATIALGLAADAGLRAAPTVYNVLTHPGSTVVADGVAKDRDGIQAIIDLAAAGANPEGAIVYFPSRPAGQFYNIDRAAGRFLPLFMRDRVILKGDGPNSNSLLKNPSTNLTFGRTFIYIWGTAFPTRWVEAPSWQVGDVAAGATRVRLQDPAAAAQFAVGGKIRVGDPRFDVYGSGQKVSHYGQLFRIEAIDAATGVLVLSHPMRRGLSGAHIQKMESCHDPVFGIETGFGTYRGGLEDLRLESNHRVSARGGAIACTLRNLDVQGYSGVFYGNSFHECSFTGIAERVKDGMELSDCCVGNVMTGISLTYRHQPGWAPSDMFVGFQEYSSFNTLQFFTLHLGDETLSNGAIRTIEGTGNRIRYGTINAHQLPTGTSRILKPNGSSNHFSDLAINCRGPAFYLDCGGGPGIEIANVRINDERGAASTGRTEIRAIGSQFRDIVQPHGAFRLTAESRDNTVTSFSHPANIRDEGANNTIRAATIGAAKPARLTNLSVRQRVSQSEALIAGFVLAGGGPKTVLARAIGPGLHPFGIADVLADPTLTLLSPDASRPVAANDDWASGAAAQEAVMAAGQVAGAFGLPAGSKDAASVAVLAPGAYTMQVGGRSGGGIVLTEIYDLDGSAAPSQLINLSTLAEVAAEPDGLITGFAVSGNLPRAFLIRAIGPGLGQFGVTGMIRQPRLTLISCATGTPVASDGGFPRDSAEEARLASATVVAGAFATRPGDAQLLVHLQAGCYTCVVSTSEGLGGLALTEIYSL